MRRSKMAMTREEALAMLRAAPHVDIAFVNDDGTPVVKTVNAVLVGGQLAFHGAPAGEKAMLPGRPALVTVKEELAIVPSYLTDPERACPATSYYRSVHVRGRFELVTDPKIKADALAALMTRFQPEGRHVPISADHPLYQKAVRGVMVMAVPLTEVTGKQNLGQTKTPEVRNKIMAGLWARGLDSDIKAVSHMLRAHAGEALPDFLQGPAGVMLDPQGQEEDLQHLVPGLTECYWNHERFLPEVIASAQRGSPAWVVARDACGVTIGTARAISDGFKTAWVGDVWVAPSWRGRGVGKAVMRLLLDHPWIRKVQQVHLMTEDAQGLYSQFGFEPRAAEHCHMVRVRAASGTRPRGATSSVHATLLG